jgi:hypothetical protein
VEWTGFLVESAGLLAEARIFWASSTKTGAV